MTRIHLHSFRQVCQPFAVIVTVTFLCELAFLATLGMPRVDNQLIGSDGIGYYAYLPSVWLDRDLDFTDEYTVFYAYNEAAVETRIHNLTPVGIPTNPWSIGPALLWSPAFALAHFFAWLQTRFGIGSPMDGYGYLYQAVVLSSSILYAGAALWFIYKMAEKLVSTKAALLATLLIAFAGNLVYYMTAEPYMSHAHSAFASAVFFLLWISWRPRFSLSQSVILGFLAGLMALVRPQDGLFLLLPFLDQLAQTVGDSRAARKIQSWWASIGNAVAAGIAALIAFSPQLLVWQILNGSFMLNGYSFTGDRFFWNAPKLGAVLFSASRGLFVWHPGFRVCSGGFVCPLAQGSSAGVLGHGGLRDTVVRH